MTVSAKPVMTGVSTIFCASNSTLLRALVPMQQTITRMIVVRRLYSRFPGWYIGMLPILWCISTSHRPAGASVSAETTYSKNSTSSEA